MKNLILIGAPGSGKGTIAKSLTSYYQISTGDILRNIAEEDSKRGRSLKEMLKKGQLVSDDLVISLVLEEIKKNKHYLLDGFPRTKKQAESYEVIKQKENLDDEVVIYLDIDEDVIVKRISGRLICPNCHQSYNLNNPQLLPKKDNTCKCGAKLIKREDDQETTVRKRFEIFQEELKGLKEVYPNMLKVNANQSVEDVLKDINKVLK